MDRLKTGLPVSKPPLHTSSNTLSLGGTGSTPAALGYGMPAEWEAHDATWLAWPHDHGDWPGRFEPIPWIYAEIIRNLSSHERVELVVNHASAEKQVGKFLDRAHALSSHVRFHSWPTNRVWMRDSGCIFLRCGASAIGRESRHKRQANNSTGGVGTALPGCPAGPAAGQLFAIKFRFNAWAKYSNWRHDEKIGSLMAHDANAQEIRPLHDNTRVVLEGGSIDVNGRGTLLTTEECLLSKTQRRNPAMSRADYEDIFSDYLGARHVIWLGAGICGDDTHGHVDDLTRFVSTDTVVTMVEPDPRDVNHKPLRDNLRRLKAAHDQDGKPLNIVELPMPRPVVFAGRRLPASYANFYIANGVVLVPVFNDPNDRIALNTLAQLFPTRLLVPIYSGDLVWGLGTMHCMTQQQPAQRK